MIEMGMRHQHQIDGRQIGYAQPRTTKTFQHKQPACEVGIDYDTLSTNLHEKAGVTDEGDAEFSIGSKAWFVSLTDARGYRGVAYQTPKLSGTFTKGRIAKCLLNHPATVPGDWTGSSLNRSS